MSKNSAMKPVKQAKNTSVEVNALLQTEIAHLWPAIGNINRLQKQCIQLLPQLFKFCQVLHLDNEQLVISVPSAAMATKLKQQLPKLQDGLQKIGWQISAIRIKVQVSPVTLEKVTEKQNHFSQQALNAFASLEKNLTQSHANQDLVDAVKNLLKRHQS